jgi:uncharacterized protein
VFLLLSVTFYLLGFADYLGIGWLGVAGGWVGILTGLDAMFVSFAEVASWAYDREVVPLGGAPIESSSGQQTQPAD